jgi:beta-lactamase regulating signal transducer with metallopeptidase domain
MSLLETVFEWVVSTTLRASGVALAILAIQLLLRPWLPAKWRHPLWLPLLLVMVLPFVPVLPLHPIPARPAVPVPPSGELVATTAGEATPAPTTNLVAPAPRVTLPLLPLLWLAGVLVTLTAGVTGYRRKLKAIRAHAVSPAPDLQIEIDDARRTAGLSRTPVVWLSREVASPAVSGLWRPVLLLPAGFPAAFTAAEARLILLHEFSHLKRHDLAQNWLLFALQALHWFNPLIWFAFARLRLDRETACDARVLALDAVDRRAEYGHALLKMQELPATGGLRLGFLGIFENITGLRSRITDISRHRRSHPAWQVGGCGLVTLIALFGSTRAREVAPQSKDAAENAADPGKAALEAKLDLIVLPELSFTGTPMSEVISILRARSKELDPDKAIATNGVNFVLRLERLPDKTMFNLADIRVTYQKKNVTLRQVLADIARAANLTMTVDANAVTLAKAGPGDPPMPMIVVKPRTLAHLPGQAVKSAAKIVIPTLTFDGLTLGEAVGLLNGEAKKHAGTVEPPLVTLHPKADAKLPIKELKLRNVPLENALIYVGDLCRMNIRADDRQIQLYPATLRNP